MAIDFVTNPGGLLVRAGRFAAGVGEANLAVGTTLDARVTALIAQFVTNERSTIDNFFSSRDSYRSSPGGWKSALKSFVQQTFINQVNRTETLPSLTLPYAVAEFRRQMVAAGTVLERDTALNATVGGWTNVTNVSNLVTGDQVAIISAKNPDGSLNNLMFPDSIVLKVTADQFNNGTAYGETCSLQGIPAVDSGAYNWPQGGGVNTSLTIQDANRLTSLLSNGGFGTWPDATLPPTGWTIKTGTIPTTITRSGTALGNSTYSLEFIGNGSELTEARQLVTVRPLTVYAVSIWIQSPTAPIAAGVIQVNLVNNANDAITTDDSSTANTLTVNCSALTTSWANLSGFFRTGTTPPASPALAIKFSTAATNTEQVLFAKVAMIPVTHLYAGGPYVAAFSGGTPAKVNDQVTFAVTNGVVMWPSPAKGALIWSLDRFLDLRNIQLPGSLVSGTDIPSAASATGGYADNVLIQ